MRLPSPTFAILLVALACAEDERPLGLGATDGGAAAPRDGSVDAGGDAGIEPDAGAWDSFCTGAGRPGQQVAWLEDGYDLVEVRRDGATRVVHTFFDGPREGWRFNVLRLWQDGGRFALYAFEREDCGRFPCPVRGELHVIHDSGAWTYHVEVSDVLPELVGIARDGVFTMTPREGLPRSFLAGPQGVTHRFEPGVVLHTSEQIEEGWWAARGYTDPDAEPELAFARTDRPLRRVRAPDRPVSQIPTWAGRWLVLDGDVVEVLGPEGTRSIPLPILVPNGSLRALTRNVFGLYDADDIVALVRPADSAVALFPPGNGHAAARPTASPSDSYVVLSEGGRPLYRVDAWGAPLSVEVLDQAELFPEGAGPFEGADYCAPPAQIDDEGRLSYGVRRPGASGWYRQTQDGLQLVGRPVHDALAATAIARGSTTVVRAASGRDTFCPQVEPWPEPAPEDALPLDRLLVVTERGYERLLPERAEVRGLEPWGRCLLWTRPGDDRTELVLTDVEMEEDRVVAQDVRGLWPAYPVFFGLP